MSRYTAIREIFYAVVATVIPGTQESTLKELDICLDVCRETNSSHIEGFEVL